MESGLNKINSRPDYLEVSEDASVDEDSPIDLRKERGKEAYKETMSKDIEIIDTYETITKVNKKMEANL